MNYNDVREMMLSKISTTAGAIEIPTKTEDKLKLIGELLGCVHCLNEEDPEPRRIARIEVCGPFPCGGDDREGSGEVKEDADKKD